MRKKKVVKRRRKNTYLRFIIIFIIFAIAITFLAISLFKKDPDPGDSQDSSSISSEPVSLSDGSQISAVSSDPVSFWGNDIDLTESVQPDNSSGYPKWPSAPSFEVPEYDLSKFKEQAGTDKPLEGAVIFIDPGHGGEDLGAVYPRHPVAPEIIESRINLDVAFKLKNILENAGAQVVLTREEDYYYQLYYRSALVGKYLLEDFLSKLDPGSENRPVIEGYISDMNETMERNNHSDPEDIFYPVGVYEEIKNIYDIQSAYSNCILISLHCNSSEQPDSVKGTQVLYATNSYVYKVQPPSHMDIKKPEYQNYNDDARKRLARLLYDNIIEDQPQMKHSISETALRESNESVLREMNLVCALVEMGYVNHTDDRGILLDETHQDIFAGSIYEAVLEYFCG